MMDRVAGISHTVLKWLRSYRGSVILLAALCLLLAVWVVPFQLAGQSTATVSAIAWGWLPLQVAYALVGLATLYCTYVRLRRDLRRASGGLRAAAEPSPQAARLEHMDDLHVAAQALSSRGYDVAEQPDRVVAVRNRWSALGGSVFHLALVLFALGVVLQHVTATSAQVRVIEGQSFGDAAKGEPGWVERAVSGLTLQSIRPAYFKDVLLFTRLDSTLKDASGSTRDSSLAKPAWLDMFTHLSVQDYGLAPSFKVTDAQGRVLDDTTVAMALNPPGARDAVTLPGSELAISAVAFPDYGVVGGKDVSLTYNLRNPRLRVAVSRPVSGVQTVRALLGVGDAVSVGQYTVRLTGIARHGTFTVFRTYATLPVALASLLMLAGLVARLFFPRHDVVMWRREGSLLADAWLDGFGRRDGLARLEAVLASGAER